MIKLPSLAGLEGLLKLDRQGVDIRPTLLRVITDQYLQKSVHTPDEELQFTELALRLLDETEVPTRATVAARLAPHATAPRRVIRRLARDVIEVAEPVLRHSPCLTPADLEAIVAERGFAHAQIIATRDPAAARPAAVDDHAAGAAPHASAGSGPTPAVAAAKSGPADAAELCDIFFAADAFERKLILVTLECVPSVPQRPTVPMRRADVWRLESAALQHNTDVVVRELERSLGISERLARRIVADELGEPIVVAAKALTLPPDVLQRMLLFMNPRVGESVDRVYELAALFGEISIEAAHRLIDIWQDAERAAPRPATHESQWHDTVQSARQALSDISRRMPPRRDPIPAALPRRAGADS